MLRRGGAVLGQKCLLLVRRGIATKAPKINKDNVRVMEKTLKPKGKADDRARESIGALEEQLKQGSLAPNEGRVTFRADGVARVSGLSEASQGNVVRFADCNQVGIICSLESSDAAVLVLGGSGPAEGEVCRLERSQLSVSVPLGGVVNGLGEPLGAPNTSTSRVLDVVLTPLISAERQPWASRSGRIETPLWTGMSSLDLLAPLAHGQSVAFFGDGPGGIDAAVRDLVMAQARGGDVIVNREDVPSHIVS